MQKITKDSKCIIFDWDGTLVSCEQLVHASYVLTFLKMGNDKAFTWSEADTHAQNGKSRQTIFSDTTIWGTNTKEAEEIFYQVYPRLQQNDSVLFQLYQDVTGKQLQPLMVYEGAKEFLHYLKIQKPNRPIVLLGAKNEELLRKEVFEAGLIQYFNRIIGNTVHADANKPSPKVFDRAVANYHISDKSSVCYIGDNPQKDIAFAQSWGATGFILTPEKLREIAQFLPQQVSHKTIPFVACLSTPHING